jgi:hypothetical protein
VQLEVLIGICKYSSCIAVIWKKKYLVGTWMKRALQFCLQKKCTKNVFNGGHITLFCALGGSRINADTDKMRTRIKAYKGLT